MKLLVLNGPNLNALGSREPEIYGALTLAQIQQQTVDLAKELNIEVDFHQSNHEGVLIDLLYQYQNQCDGFVLNPGSFTHYSYALRVDLASIAVPCIEVHLSNIYKREEFRHHSVIAPVAMGQIAGLGAQGYLLAIRALVQRVRGNRD